ncbi:MAG: hypothetical protein Q9163_002762 [Psora crenata]
MPRKNLIPLLFFRPLRLCIPSEQMRSARIALLKVTHAPYIASIWLYEGLARHMHGKIVGWRYIPRGHKGTRIGSLKGRPDPSQAPGGRKGMKMPIPRTPTTPMNAAGRPSSFCSMHIDTVLGGLQDTLDAMAQKVEQLGKRIDKSTVSREDLVATLTTTEERFEKLRNILEANEKKIDQLLAKS